jgi:drug/metabolite transporter (DMT)-like permease
MTSRGRAELLLLGSTLIWGGTFVIVKLGLEDISPLLLLTIRFAIATLIFLPFVFRFLKTMTMGTFVRGSILGILLSIGFISQTIGMQYTTASKSGFITGLLVVFTPIFQILIERRVPRLGNVIGIGLVMVGLYLLTAPEGSSFTIGDALTLLCAAVFGLYIVYLDVFTKSDDFRLLAFLQFVVTLVASGVGYTLFEVPRFQASDFLFGALAYLAVLATVLTLVVQTRYQKDTTPTRAAVIFSLEPVFAALLAYVVIGEQIGTLGVIGGAVVVGGLLVSELWDRPLAGVRQE